MLVVVDYTEDTVGLWQNLGDAWVGLDLGVAVAYSYSRSHHLSISAFLREYHIRPVPGDSSLEGKSKTKQRKAVKVKRVGWLPFVAVP